MGQRNFCFSTILLRCLLASGAVLLVTGCGGDSSGGTSIPVGSGQMGSRQNQVPRISGTPPTVINVGTAYSFQPSASDADGDAVSFQISRLPSWATFNSVSGAITGTPTSADVGTTTNIVISVSDGRASASLASFAIHVQSSPTPPPPGSNLPPTILGTPPASAASGQTYTFQPSASDPNGDSLTFIITNQPAWSTFNATTGRLTGTPTPADVGTYSNITIRVSDGTASASLAPFSIAVAQISTGSATISWLSPTQNTDGTTLTDLAGFRIYYGTNATNLTQMVNITNPGLTSYVIQNLGAATWYFTVRAYAADGAESAPSNLASKTIQ